MDIFLKRLEIKNFKNTEEAAYDFSERGLFLVVGPNGAGKTTIPDALFWLLYGETLKGARADSVVREAAGKDCLVSGYFRIDGKEVLVQRARKHKKLKNSFLCFVDEEKVPKKQAQSLFPDKETALNTVFFSKDWDDDRKRKLVLHAGSEARMRFFDAALKTEHYPEMKKAAARLRRISKERLGQLDLEKKKLEESLKEKKDEIRSLEKEFSSRKKEHSERLKLLKEKVSKAKELVKSKKSVAAALEKSKRRVDRFSEREEALSKEIAVLKLETEAIEKEAAEVRKAFKEKLKKELEYEELLFSKKRLSALRELEKSFKEDFQMLEETEKKFLERKSKISQEASKELSRSRKPLEEKLASLEKDLSTLTERLESLRKSLEKDREKRKTKKDRLLNIERLLKEDKCPLCESTNFSSEVAHKRKKEAESLAEELKVLEKTIEKASKELESIKTQLEKKNKELSKTKKALEDLSKRVELESAAKLTKLEEALRACRRDFKALKEEEALEKEALEKKLSKELEAKKKSISEALEKEQKETLTALGEKLSKKTQRLFKQKERKGFLSRKIAKESDHYSQLKEKLVSIELSEKELPSLIESLEKEKKTTFSFFEEGLEKKKKELQALEKSLEDFEKEEKEAARKASIYSFWEEGFSAKGMKSFLFANFLKSLNALCEENSYVLSNGTLSLRFEQTEKDCVPIVKNYKTGQESLKTLSAGEATLLDLIAMVSLSKFFEHASGKRMSVIFFDEVFDSLDEENSQRVAQALLRSAEDKSVGLITHSRIWKAYSLTDKIIDFFE